MGHCILLYNIDSKSFWDRNQITLLLWHRNKMINKDQPNKTKGIAMYEGRKKHKPGKMKWPKYQHQPPSIPSGPIHISTTTNSLKFYFIFYFFPKRRMPIAYRKSYLLDKMRVIDETEGTPKRVIDDSTMSLKLCSESSINHSTTSCLLYQIFQWRLIIPHLSLPLSLKVFIFILYFLFLKRQQGTLREGFNGAGEKRSCWVLDFGGSYVIFVNEWGQITSQVLFNSFKPLRLKLSISLFFFFWNTLTRWKEGSNTKYTTALLFWLGQFVGPTDLGW